MMRRVIVHIGMHKTGSSSIQYTLFNNLTDPAFEYANFEIPNHSGRVFSLFSETPEKYHAHRKRGWERKEIDSFNAEVKRKLIYGIERSTSPNIIISGEDISNLDESALNRFKSFLARFFQEICIVGYVRSPRSYMESSFQQRVKGSLSNLNFYDLYPNYRERFEKFDRVFGAECVHLWKFNQKLFPQGDVVLDFCRRLNIDMCPESVKRINESISKEALSLLFIYRKYGPGYGVGPQAIPDNNRLIAVLSAIGCCKIRFSPNAVRPVLDAKCEDISWVESRIGESLSEDIYESDEDIRCEEDLLSPSVYAVDELVRMIGEKSKIHDVTPQKIADMVCKLRKKLADERNATKMQANNVNFNNKVEWAELSIVHITQSIKLAKPLLIPNTSDERVADIIKEAFGLLCKHINTSDSNVIQIQGLGRFFVKTNMPVNGLNSNHNKKFLFRGIRRGHNHGHDNML